MELTLFTKCVFEFIGTLVLVLLGDGVCAGCTLEKSKSKGAGWVVITLAWGFAVMCGVFIAGPYSGAHLNPAVTLGLAMPAIRMECSPPLHSSPDARRICRRNAGLRILL